MASHINILVSTFGGISSTKTLAFAVPCNDAVFNIWSRLEQRIPALAHSRLVLSTLSGKHLPRSSYDPISSFLSTKHGDLLSLRLWTPLCGGKGGFGSQLRAAGGRMSSRRKRNEADENGSSRNLDGRRLRTVKEAKALAEYLALKPEMERKEREERRQRLELVIEMAERRQDEIRNGSRSKGRMDAQWQENRDEANERTREAVLSAMKSGTYKDNPLPTSHSSTSSTQSEPTSSANESQAEQTSGQSSRHTTPSSEPANEDFKIASKLINTAPKAMFGFDDDENMSSDDE